MDDVNSAAGLLEKLRAFASGLSDHERELLAALLAPGIDAAWQDESAVAGYTDDDWSPDRLPAHLASVIRDEQIRVERL